MLFTFQSKDNFVGIANERLVNGNSNERWFNFLFSQYIVLMCIDFDQHIQCTLTH